MVVVDTAVYYIEYGLKRRIYKTARRPTRYYYLVDNRQWFVDPDEIPDDVRNLITVKNKKER